MQVIGTRTHRRSVFLLDGARETVHGEHGNKLVLGGKDRGIVLTEMTDHEEQHQEIEYELHEPNEGKDKVHNHDPPLMVGGACPRNVQQAGHQTTRANLGNTSNHEQRVDAPQRLCDEEDDVTGTILASALWNEREPCENTIDSCQTEQASSRMDPIDERAHTLTA